MQTGPLVASTASRCAGFRSWTRNFGCMPASLPHRPDVATRLSTPPPDGPARPARESRQVARWTTRRLPMRQSRLPAGADRPGAARRSPPQPSCARDPSAVWMIAGAVVVWLGLKHERAPVLLVEDRGVGPPALAPLLEGRRGWLGDGAHYRGSVSRVAVTPYRNLTAPGQRGCREVLNRTLTHRCPPAIRRRLGSTAGGSVAVGPAPMPDLSGSEASEGIWDAAA